MYYDVETDSYYESRRGCLRVKLWLRVRNGELRPIEGFGRYTITEEGEVLNIQRATPVRPATNGNRPIVQLTSDDGRRATLGLARLVASHFIPRPQDGQYYDAVNQDGNLFNNHVNNLAWVPRWKRHVSQGNYSVDV